MRRSRAGLSLLSAVLLGLVGCASTDPFVKPPPPPEEYRLPPSDVARFSKPIEYPKDAMDQNPRPRPTMGAGGPPGMGGRMGGMGGMGPSGMGGAMGGAGMNNYSSSTMRR